MSGRTFAIFSVLVLLLAGIGASVRKTKPGYFILERKIEIPSKTRPEQMSWIPGRNAVLLGMRYLPVEIVDVGSEERRPLFGDLAHGDFAVSIDGKSAAIAMPGPELRIYDLATGKVRQTLHETPGDGRECMAWSPDGQKIALGERRTILILDLKTETAKSLTTGAQNDHVNSVKFSPDGRLLGVGTWQGVVSLWKTDTWTLSQEFDLGSDPRTGGNGMVSVAFSPDGTLFAAGGGDGWTRTDGSAPVTSGALRIWKTGDRTLVLSQVLEQAADSLCFSPDGTLLAYSTWGWVHVIDGSTGKELWSTRMAASGMNPAVSFAQDGRLACLDNRGLLQIWKRRP